MSESTNQIAVTRERAAQDLSDINELKHSVAFNRYFLRRLKAKREEILRRFIREPSDECPPMKREGYRAQILLIDEIAVMGSADEQGARSTLDSTPGVVPQIIPPSSGQGAAPESSRMIGPASLPEG